jgi:hypothetical protein
VFSTRSVQRVYKEDKSKNISDEDRCVQHCMTVGLVEAGVEYLHRSPASRRRRRKGKSRI